MALTHAQCRQMNEACSDAGVPLFVAYYRRRLPAFVKVAELLQAGAGGRGSLCHHTTVWSGKCRRPRPEPAALARPAGHRRGRLLLRPRLPPARPARFSSGDRLPPPVETPAIRPGSTLPTTSSAHPSGSNPAPWVRGCGALPPTPAPPATARKSSAAKGSISYSAFALDEPVVLTTPAAARSFTCSSPNMSSSR